MPYLIHYLQELSAAERSYIESLLAQMPREHAEAFVVQYSRRRKDPQTVLLAAVIGLCACPGFQRFWLGEVGMGLLFLITAGFLAMGSVIDLATYKTLALSHNQKVARQILMEIQILDLPVHSILPGNTEPTLLVHLILQSNGDIMC
jgi:TM2 domain